MNYEGVRSEYLSGLSESLAMRIPPELWELDWARMQEESRREIYFELFCDYQSHIDRFPAIAHFHKKYQPPALLLWGKQDPYFEIDEIEAFQKALDVVEPYILEGSHFLLETHAAECARIIRKFLDKYPVTSS